MPHLGPTELVLILVIVVIFFGVGRLPEVFGAIGKGLREFRKATKEVDASSDNINVEVIEDEKPTSS